MRHFFGILLSLMIAGISLPAQAEGIFYLGLGEAEAADETTTDDTPFVIGVLGFAQNSKAVFGFDIAGEGTMLDSTYAQESLRQAISFNFLAGVNLVNSGKTRIDAAALVGLRESFADCPDSFLGFQCYADLEPSQEFKVNYGALIAVSFNRVTIGVRATGESTQVVAGFRF